MDSEQSFGLQRNCRNNVFAYLTQTVFCDVYVGNNSWSMALITNSFVAKCTHDCQSSLHNQFFKERKPQHTFKHLCQIIDISDGTLKAIFIFITHFLFIPFLFLLKGNQLDKHQLPWLTSHEYALLSGIHCKISMYLWEINLIWFDLIYKDAI